MSRSRRAPEVPAQRQFTRFRVLGPVELLCRGGSAEIGSAKTRSLLAALLLQANRFVSSAHLAEVLWGGCLPPTYRTTLYSHVMRLRHFLEGYGCAGVIHTEPAGYLIEADADTLDLLTFGRFLEAAGQARQEADPVGELMALTSACGLWSGPALANVDSDLLHREEVPRLTEELLRVLERQISVGLGLGRYAEFLGELRELTTRYPHRERFWAQLMEAYCLAGRRSEALTAYADVRRLLAGELGIEPGPDLRDLHMRILRGEGLPGQEAGPATVKPAPPVAAAPVVAAGARAAPPGGMCQLPCAVPGFVGRASMIAELVALLGGDQGQQAARVAVLHGAPAVGKTAVAVRAAHELRGQFPDGQWFVTLGASAGAPRPPGELLGDLLHSAGVHAGAIPPGETARAALLRACLADRAVLLLLDDAASVGQVEPLLPGAGQCRVLVTSRCSLRGLAALYGASVRRLPPLNADESRQLLLGLLGDRAGDVANAEALARLCGHVPLALRIAAATFAARRGLDLAAFVSDLDCPDRLRRLALPGEGRLSLRAVIAPSYDCLDPSTQRLLRVLARCPDPRVTAERAATAAGLPLAAAEASLAELADTGLLDEDWPYFLVPELIRLFAAGMAGPRRRRQRHRDGGALPSTGQVAASPD
jgi:DNA-binding SARP family transcriptional activator